MKNNKSKLGFISLLRIVLVIMLCTFFLFNSTSLMAKDKFSVNADGSIVAGEESFASMKEYVLSDYFRESGKRCGSKAPEVSVDPQVAKSINDCTLQLTRIQNEYWLSDETITVQVWFHVIHSSIGTGNISDAAINNQLKVLNEDYRAMAGTMGSPGFDTKVQFVLAGVTRTSSNFWFSDAEGAHDAYTKALNKDPNKYVNIYTNTASGYLGYAFFPQGGVAGNVKDGIVMNYQAIGGRNNGFQIYDQGRTLVHEMGHYFGLYHTFEGFSSCINSYSGGDLIFDTPAESEDHYQCTQTYTCGTPDPIYNYMNYTPDSCMNRFSSEQANRLVCGLVNYRPELPVVDENAIIVPNVLTPLLFTK